MVSDNSPKEEGVQIEDIQHVVKEIFTIYKKFYEAKDDVDIIQRPDCKYMQEEVEKSKETELTNETPEQDYAILKTVPIDIPPDTKARYDKLADDLIHRVERKDFIGYLERGITHKTAKALRTDHIDAMNFFAVDAVFLIPDIVGAGTELSLAADGAKKIIKTTIDSLYLAGMEVLSATVGKTIEFVNEKRKGKKGRRQEYEEEEKGELFKGDIASKLKDMDDDKAKALFKLLGRVYQYYMPKINIHFNQCHDAYEDLFKDIFKNEKEPEKDEDLEEKKPEFKFCDDIVEFTEKVYRLYHEIYKLRQYMMPMLRFMQCIAVQAEIWQKFWNDNHLWETQKIIEKLKEFDRKNHQDCEYTNLCYGPHKIYITTDWEGGWIKDQEKGAVGHSEVGPNIQVDYKKKPHHKIDHRSPWKKSRRGKPKKVEDCKRENHKLKNGPELEGQVKKIEESHREYVLNDKNDRIAQFVSAAQKSVGAKEDDVAIVEDDVAIVNVKEDDVGIRFQALVTDVGLFTEYKGLFKGQWRWAKDFFKPKSYTKTTFNILVCVAAIGGGIAIAPIAAAATAGVAVGIAVGWGTFKFVTTKVSEKVVDSFEGKYDRKAIEKGKAWYGKEGDKRRIRINRNADASAKVVSHFLSSIKNYKQLKDFWKNDKLPNINNCDELAQYLWSVYKLQHHACKMVEYNRPMLDFVITCEKNLERWANCYNKHIDRCMKYCYDFLLSDKDHIESCGLLFEIKAFRLMRQPFKKGTNSNTNNIGFHKSRFCYGPKSPKKPTKIPHEKVLRPMDLQVWKDVFKKETKREKVRLKLTKQGEEQPATQALSNDKVCG